MNSLLFWGELQKENLTFLLKKKNPPILELYKN